MSYWLQYATVQNMNIITIKMSYWLQYATVQNMRTTKYRAVSYVELTSFPLQMFSPPPYFINDLTKSKSTTA